MASNSVCCGVSVTETTRLEHHAPAPIVTAVALANGLKFTADAYGGLAVWTPANLVQFATRVSLRNDGSERITGLHVWDAWEEGAPKQPKKGPRWYAAAVVTYSANRWFDARGQRMHSRVLVWNVFNGNVTHLRMGASASAAYMSHVTHLNNYRNMVICSCQDGSIVAWEADRPGGQAAILSPAMVSQVPSLFAAVHVVADDPSLMASSGNKYGAVLVAVTTQGPILLFDLWGLVRDVRARAVGAAPLFARPLGRIQRVGVVRDTILDAAVARTEATGAQQLPRSLVLCLVLPRYARAAVVRHFYVDELVAAALQPSSKTNDLSPCVVQPDIKFQSYSRIAVSSNCVAVAGTGMVTMVSGPQHHPWDLAAILRDASADAIVLDDYAEGSGGAAATVVDAADARPRVYRWLYPRLNARTLTRGSFLVSTSPSDKSSIAFARMSYQVVAFSTALAGGKKAAPHVMDGVLSGQPTQLLDAGCGDDDEADILIADSRGKAVVVDTKSRLEPVRRTKISLLDALPGMLNAFIVALQLSALCFLRRVRMPWHEAVDPLRVLLAATLFDFDGMTHVEFPIVFVISITILLVGLISAFFYWRVETLRKVPDRQPNTRLDDGCFLRLVWWLVWLPSTILFIPILRTMLYPAECDGTDSPAPGVAPNDDTLDWFLDATPDDEFDCFQAPHLPWFIAGLIGGVLIILFSFRLGPVAGDVAQVRTWWTLAWIERPAQRLFLGPFTQNRVAAPVNGITLFIVKMLLAVGATVYGRWPAAIAAVVAVHLALLLFMSWMFPAFNSSTANFMVITGYVVALWTSLCGLCTAAVDDPEAAWPVMLLYIGWVAAIIVVIVRACIGCSRRQRHPQAGVVLKSRRKKMARRGSALQASGLVTVTSAPPRDTRPAPEFPGALVKEWMPLTAYDPVAWALSAAAGPSSGGDGGAGAAAGDGGAGAGAGAGTGAGAGADAEDADNAETWKCIYGEKRVGDYSTDANAVRATVDATVAEHEREKVSLLSRLDAERRRQRARVAARAARRKRKHGVAPAGSVGTVTGTEEDRVAAAGCAQIRTAGVEQGDEDTRQALEWVYQEHDAQVASLQARLEAERAEQRAHLEERRQAREAAAKARAAAEGGAGAAAE